MFEKVIEVDGEPAVVTLLDTWDAEVRQPVTITALSCQKPCETVITFLFFLPRLQTQMILV